MASLVVQFAASSSDKPDIIVRESNGKTVGNLMWGLLSKIGHLLSREAFELNLIS